MSNEADKMMDYMEYEHDKIEKEKDEKVQKLAFPSNAVVSMTINGRKYLSKVKGFDFNSNLNLNLDSENPLHSRLESATFSFELDKEGAETLYKNLTEAFPTQEKGWLSNGDLDSLICPFSEQQAEIVRCLRHYQELGVIPLESFERISNTEMIIDKYCFKRFQGIYVDYWAVFPYTGEVEQSICHHEDIRTLVFILVTRLLMDEVVKINSIVRTLE